MFEYLRCNVTKPKDELYSVIYMDRKYLKGLGSFLTLSKVWVGNNDRNIIYNYTIKHCFSNTKYPVTIKKHTEHN